MKFRNVSGVDLEVPAAGMVVPAGEVIEVDGPLAEGMTGQDSVWAPVVARASTETSARPSRSKTKKTTEPTPAAPPAATA